MMRWQANKNGSTLVGGSTLETQTGATPVRLLNCGVVWCGVCVCVFLCVCV